MVVILPMLPPELTLAPVHTRLPSNTRTDPRRGLQLVLLHQRFGSKFNQSSIVVVSFPLQVQKIIDNKVKKKNHFYML